MSPELSRKIGLILGLNFVYPQERDRIIAAAIEAEQWEDLPPDVVGLLDEISRRGSARPNTH